jgi:thiol-disulfide isomerase/thioredoxin
MLKRIERLPARAVAHDSGAVLNSYIAPSIYLVVGSWLLILLCQAVLSAAPPADSTAGKKNSSAAEAKVEVASFAQVQAEVAKHKGKVVVVDYWSSWCPPCVKELPEMAQLHKELGKQIVCFTVDVDFAGAEGEKPEEHRENVLGILTQNQLTMRNFISSDPDMTVFKKLNVGSVPVLHVFDRAGKLHMTFTNEDEKFGKDGFSILKDVKPVVLQLMK